MFEMCLDQIQRLPNISCDLVYDVWGGTFVEAALLSIGSPAWTNDVQSM